MSLEETIRTYFEYHIEMTRRVWESTHQLSEAQFVAEIPHSRGSVRNQMVHLATTDARWVRGLQGQPGGRELKFNPADYPTIQSAEKLWENVVKETLAYLNSLTEADLIATPAGMRGPVWQVLVHLANHGTDHRAQVLRALHDFGAPTFDQDFIMYMWSR
jgi:uncharacterized damage-inducible protein DinB